MKVVRIVPPGAEMLTIRRAPDSERDRELAERFFEKGHRVEAAVTIQRPAADLYRAWTAYERLPEFIDELESVTVSGDGTLTWTIRGPLDRSYSWDARIIHDKPNQLVAWITEEAEIPNAGSVRFRELPFHRGTEVTVVIEHIPPGGKAGELVAKVFGSDPTTMVRPALYRFRMLMESGEIATTDGQPAGHDRAEEAPGNGRAASKGAERR